LVGIPCGNTAHKCTLSPYIYETDSHSLEASPISATQLLINLIGSVALLLWGMRMVRTGISRALGSSLRHAIGRSVSNRFKAFVMGIGVTSILQSSTATGLIIASFSGRGLMDTAPALAVMLGADVGTTLVAQVLSFDISWLAPMLILLGVVMHFTAKKTLHKQLGRTGIGLGIMLLALGLIVQSSTPMRESAVLQNVFSALGDERMMAVLLAALLTWMAHSSLAVVLMVMSLAAGSVVPLSLAFVLVIGANLGGSLPPVMATWAKEPEARRVPLANAFFKAMGCLILLPLVDVVGPYMAMIEGDAARQIVNFHTFFNLFIATVFIFTTDIVANFINRALPPAPQSEDPGTPRYLDRAYIDDPAIALASAARETVRMGDIVEGMLRDSIKALQNDDQALARTVIKMDNAVDKLHESIKLYVTEASRERLDDEDSRRATNILTFTTDLEHIGDIVENLMEITTKKIKKKMQFSPDGFTEIVNIHQKVADNLKLALGAFISDDTKLAHQLLEEKGIVKAMERAGAENHMERLRQGRPESIETSALHMDILRDLKRIHSHIVAIAYPVLENAGELDRKDPVDEVENGSND
jgi:phosphate:Na+ symporter